MALALSFGPEIPFVHHLGFQLHLFEGGRSVIAFDPQPEHLNSFNVAHGGAIMTLLDVSMAVAARSVDKEFGVVTIEMKTSFMRPCRGALRGQGRLLHRTATLAFVEGDVLDAEGNLCAHSTGTFKYVKRLSSGPSSANNLNPPISTD